MIRYHFDPLFRWDPSEMTVDERVEFSRRLALWGAESPQIPSLSDDELQELSAFLETLSFLETDLSIETAR